MKDTCMAHLTRILYLQRLGQHSDARELAALYIQAGVPIYSLCLGHSYHTLVWKMEVEARQSEQNGTQSEGEQTNEHNSSSGTNQGERDNPRQSVDRFFVQRYANRPQDGDDIPNSSYLEEKCLFCYNKAAETDSRLGARTTMTSRTRFAPPAPVLGPAVHGAWDGRNRLPEFRPAESNGETRYSPQMRTQVQKLAYSDASRIPPKVRVKMHRHLVDQYLLGRRAVDDENGAMVAPAISLAADFFHQKVRSRRPFGDVIDGNIPANVVSLDDMRQQDFPVSTVDVVQSSSMPHNGTFELTPTFSTQTSFSFQARLNDQNIDIGDERDVTVPENTLFVDSQPGSQNSLAVSELGLQPDTGANTPRSGYGTPLQPRSTDIPPSPPPPPPVPTPDELSSSDFSMQNEPAFLSSIDLEIYDAASLNGISLSDHRDGTAELKSHLRNRFGVYQRRLETLLSQNDSSGFEECLLDFWDEFLPVSANIHFYDNHTAVPRTSGLHKFLTKPCPKAFGIVQCEIERIKINSKRKGVNMKGRLFPTYEYRLFIRDRRHDSSTPESATDQEANQPPRRDTILMMAKNRGRKHQEPTGVLPVPGSSKKGVNNYYLYMPQQVDVDAHYRTVNNIYFAELMPNGASCQLPTRTGDINSPVLLGRLQSNFIGTEFQIFTPTLQKTLDVGKKSLLPRSNIALSSDSESEYEVSSDNANPIPRSRNRFHRRKSSQGFLRRKNRDPVNELNHPQPISEEESVGSPSSSGRRKYKRAYSLPNFAYRGSTRSSRRAVAHSVDSPFDVAQQLQPVLCEEEDGAITYTANLLGNRPRIMDVCIPKVSDNGVAGAEWKRYLGSVEESSEVVANSMLSHFKQLQQRLENPDQNNIDQGDNSETNDFGLLALQNRPPWWNVELGAFVLNFGGRVSVASVKNFQLCDRTDHDHIMLQFGRIQGRHSFTMDFQHPLTAVQAFAIAISSLQSRISFG